MHFQFGAHYGQNILDAVRKQVIGKRARFTAAQMKSLFDAGMTLQEILELIASRLTSSRRPPVSCRDPVDWKA